MDENRKQGGVDISGTASISGDLVAGNKTVYQQLPAVDVGKEAVRKILSPCYRRAIFTRMHAQMSHEAMLQSIADALRLAQPQIPNITNADSQMLAAKIIAELDGIVRMGSNITDYQTPENINAAKLRVLQLLSTLAEKSGLTFTIPQGHLVEDAFFTREDADQAPAF